MSGVGSLSENERLGRVNIELYPGISIRAAGVKAMFADVSSTTAHRSGLSRIRYDAIESNSIISRACRWEKALCKQRFNSIL